MTVGETADLILEYYRPFMKDRYDDWHVRLNDLEALVQIAGRYASLDTLLEDFSIEPPDRGVLRIEPETKEEERPLVISTIHSAKGLEWDTVYIMGLMDGVLPITFSLDDEAEIEEERRLLYVAVTRAKNRLFLTLHHEGMRGGITQFNRPSRFLETPGVRMRLATREKGKARSEGSAEEGGGPLYDRDSLLRRIMDFLE